MPKNNESVQERFERLNKAIRFIVDPVEYDRAKAALELVRSEIYAADVEETKSAEYESAKLADLEKAKQNQEYKSKVVNSLAEIDACETRRARLEDKMLSSLQEAYSAARECISNSDAIYQNMQTAFGYGQSIGEVYPEGYLPLFDNKYKIGQPELIKMVFDNYLDASFRIAGMIQQGIEPKFNTPGRWVLAPPQEKQRWLYTGKLE